MAVSSPAEFARLSERVMARGFQPDTTPGAPICRWIADDLVLDLVPDQPDVLGFTNPWYGHVLASAEPFRFEEDPEVRVVAAPAFVLTKWAAFLDRGSGTDYYGSHDLEDILTVLDGRAEVVAEASGTPPDVRAALRELADRLLGEPRFANALPGLVEPGRGEIVAGRLRALAALT